MALLRIQLWKDFMLIRTRARAIISMFEAFCSAAYCFLLPNMCWSCPTERENSICIVSCVHAGATKDVSSS